MFLIMGRGGSSSGSTSDYGSRGPESIPVGSLAFFLSSLSYLSVSGASLISVPGGGATLLIFLLSKEKMEGLAVQLDAKLNTH